MTAPVHSEVSDRLRTITLDCAPGNLIDEAMMVKLLEIMQVANHDWDTRVMVLDSAKGIIAVAIAWRIMPENRAAAATIAGLVAIIGHNWSLFATMITGKLRGGKGAATAFGTLLMVAPFQTLVIGFAISTVIVIFTRYMSLGVLVMFTLSLVWMAVLIVQRQMPAEFIYYASISWGMLMVRFRENIQRLVSGTERRLGESA